MANTIVSSGITSDGIIINRNQSMSVLSGGTVNSTTFNSGGFLYVSSGGTANSTMVSSGGKMNVYNGGEANSTTVYFRGSMFVSSGGTANSTTVNSGGRMSISSGGVANEIIENGGWVYVSSGANAVFASNTISGLVLSNTSASIHSGTTAISITLSSGGILSVSSGGTANEIVENGGYVLTQEGASVTFVPNTFSGVVLSNASASIHSGTTANRTTLNFYGYLSVSSGGTANVTTVNSSGALTVSSGGTANSATVNSYGWLGVSSGGTAVAVVENGGNVWLEDGASATFVKNSFSGLVLLSGRYATVHSGTTANSTTVNSGSLNVSSGGTANVTTVNSSGNLRVYSGGTANSTTVNNGSVSISSGGMVNVTTVNSGGFLYVSSGGTANSTTVNPGGRMYVSNGGNVNEITENGGHAYVPDGVKVVFASNTISGLVLSNALATVHSGTTANSTTVYSGGSIYIYSGGTANIITVSEGKLNVYSGGTARDTTVNSGGSTIIYSTGKLTGKIVFNNGANVSAYSGGILDFDLTCVNAGEGALVNDLSFVKGLPAYTLTVDGTQENGCYVLTGGAADFDKTLSVVNTSGTQLGTLAVGNTLTVDGTTYALSLTNSNLTVSVDNSSQGDSVTSSGLVLINEDRTVYSGEIYEDTAVSSGGMMFITSEGIAINTTIDEWGTVHVSSGGSANATTIFFNGYLYVSNGGVVDDTTLDYWGELRVLSGGTANGIILNQYGSLAVISGGTAMNIIADSESELSFEVASDTYVQGMYNGQAFEMKDAFLSDYTINGYASIIVNSGGSADTILNSGGSFQVCSGGSVNNIINANGRFFIQFGGLADNTSVGSGGSMYVDNSGTANNVFMFGGYLYISSGGMANNITLDPGGHLSVSSGGTATAIRENGGYVSVSSDTEISFVPNTFSGLTLSNMATLHSGTTANDVVVSGGLEVYDGGVVNHAIVSSTFRVRSGGIANDTIIERTGGRRPGFSYIANGGMANRTVLNGGDLFINSGGVANDTINNDAYMEVTGLANNTTLNGGKLYVSSGGLMNNIIVNSGGFLGISSGGKLTGQIDFVNGAVVSAYSGSILDFDITQATADGTALVNGLSIVQGTLTYTLTVDGTQGNGDYILAEGANSFNGTLVVVNTNGEWLGELNAGDTITVSQSRYTLSHLASSLVLYVSGTSVEPEVHTDFEVSDFIAPTAFVTGETASFSWNLTNNGEMPLDGVRQSLCLVNADDPTRKTLLKSVYLTDLPGFGETAAQTMDLTWNDTMGYANSLFQVVIEADGDVQPDDNTAVSASQYHFEQKLSIEKLPDSFTENTGRIRVVARRTGSPDEALSAEIVLTDASGLVSTPQTVTFAAGESEKVFYLTVGNNAEYQGNADIQVGLQAQGYEGYSQSVTLTDDELPSLSFAVAAEELTEGDTFTAFGKVQLDHALDHDLRVKLAYDKTQLSGIPDYVVIKAGETEAAFALTVIDDATAEIDKNVKLTATADGVKSGTASLLIHDNDVPAIALSVNKTVVSEGDGVYALVGTITRTDNSTNYVKVKFADVDNSGLILPSTVTLGTGAQSVNFYIGIVDNALVDGDRTATVKANIYIDSCGCTVIPVSGETQVSFTILDNDGEALGLSFSRSNVAENTTGAAKLTITRNTVNGDALTVNLSVTGSALLDLPDTVQFEAGQNSVTIDVNTLTDGINTGNQMAVVTASAEGYASAAGYLNISDVDLPDFVISEVSPAETPAYAGKTTLVNLTLANSGFLAYSGKVNVKLSLSNGTELGTYKVNGPFEVGETKQVGFYVNLPEITGTQTILAEVDPDNLISELNDGNNTAFSASFEVKLDYIVTVETEPEVLYTKAPITVTGTTKRMDGTAIGNMPVEVLLKAATGEKLLKTTSDAEGNYALTVDPSDLYAGSYAVYAGNLGSYGAAQDRVEIAGMKVNQSRTAFTWDVENRSTTEGSFTVSNLSGVALSGVTIHAVNAPDNFVFVSDGPAALDANGQLTVNYTITAAGETEGGGYELTYGWQKIDFIAESDEGVTTEFSGYFYSNPQVAVLTLSETKDVRTLYSGKESFYEFQITNTGFGDTGEIHLNLPENDLIKIISNPVIENLAYGESATVTLKVNPVALGNGLSLNAPYTGSIGISAENAKGTQFAFDYTFITNDKGSITITLTDEWTQYAADHPMLSGAKVGVYNAYTEKIVKTEYSDQNGVVNISDLAEGKYILKYSADGHNNAQEVVTVRGGETLELNTFLQVSTVNYTWDVQRVELTDTYEIVLSTEFETNVPAPVVTISGPTVLPELAWGESTLMNFTVTNHGLIAAQDFTFNLPEIGNGYSWRVLNDQPFDLAPNSAATITVLLERNTYTDSKGTVYVCKDGVFRSSQDGKVFYEFNDGGNVSKIIYEDSSSEEFEYDEHGRKTSYINRNGEKTWYFYSVEGNTVEWRSGMSAPIDIILPETTSLEAGETAEIIVSVWNTRAENEEGLGYLLLKSDKDISMIAGNGASGENQMFFLTSDQNSTWGERNEYTVYVTNHSEEAIDLADLVISNSFTSDLTDENPFDVSMISGERPDSVSDETWNAYLNALSEYVGTSWASYQERLNEVISICEQTETKITDTDYYNYLIQAVAYYNSVSSGTDVLENDSNLPENTLTACNGYVNLKYYMGDGAWDNLNLSTPGRYFDKQNKTIVLIHGWNNTYNQDWLTKIADELKGITGYNILSVDWDKWANTMYAGATLSVVADGVNRLLSDLGVTPDLVIGHSFGAHIGGMIEGGTHIALDLADDWGLSFIPQIVSLTGSDSELADFAAFCSFVNLTVPLNEEKRLENLTNRYYKQHGDNEQEWPTEVYEQYNKEAQIVRQFAKKEKKDFYNNYWEKVSELAKNVFKRERIDTLYKSSWIAGTEERLGKYNYLLTRGKKLTLVARLLADHSYAADGFLNILKLYQKEDKNEKIGIWYNHIVPTRLSTWHGIINGETGEFENLTVSDRLPYNRDGKTLDPFSIYEDWKESGNLCDSNGNVLVEKKLFNLYLENKSNKWKDAAEYNGLFADICISRFEVCESSNNNTEANNSNNSIDFSNKMISISMDVDDISNNYSYKYPFLSCYRYYVVYTYLSKDSTLNINEDVSLETEKELRRLENGTTTISISLNTPSFQSNKDFFSSLEKDGEYYKAYLFTYVKSVYSEGVIFREIHDEFELNPQNNIISTPSEIKIRFSPEAIINYTSNSPVISINTVTEDVMFTPSGSSSPIMIDTVFSYLQPTIGGNQIYYSLDGEKSISFNQKRIVSYQWYKANKSDGSDNYNLSENEYSTEKVLSFECCSYDSSQMYVLKVTDSDGNFDYTAYNVIVGDYLFADAGEDATYTVSMDSCSSDSIPLTIYLDGSNSSTLSKYYFWRRVNGENEYWLSGRDNTSPVISTSVEVSKFGGTFTYSLTTIDADGNESSPDYVTITVVPTTGTGDCILQTNGKYYVPCRDMEEHDVPHYMINPCCTDTINSVALVSTNTTSSSGTVPTRTNNNNNSAGGGGFNSPSISTTCTTCKPYVKSGSASATPDGGMMSFAAVMSDSEGDGELDSICAHVKVEFKQTAVMSREGFEGTLTLTNEAATEMTNITFTATVLNSAGEDVSDLFEIAYNGTDGFSITQNGDMEEYGLGNKGTGTFTVLYVPGRYTSTEGPEDYQFTGTICYTDSLVGDVSIDLTPITLTVNPSPSLQLHYFVERDVYADDPFTDAIEKSIPAEISVLVVNAGKGDARNFSLSGLMPEIVDNQKGLLLNYTMTDAAMNSVKNDNGIVDVNFGTVAANSSAVAQWWYETNIQGHYSDYSVNFTQMDYSYVDLYGNTRYVAAANRPDVSLIESADIHELIRSVQCGDDELPDFLVDDLADDGDTPDTLYLSTGAVEDVNAVFAAVSNGTFGTNDVTITLTAEFAEAGTISASSPPATAITN